jgi:nucleotide-binding universal stress UspA family protein
MRRNPGFNRILFAVNGSQHSAAAVPVVSALASNSQAEVIVLHVGSPDDVRLRDDNLFSRGRNDETNVTAVVERLRAAGVSAVGESREATAHSVAAFIANRAESLNVDLIALGNRGLSELHSFLIGSRTQQVLAQATRPVLAVRNVKPRRASGISRVVIALDGSGDHAGVVQACIDVAQPASAEVEVIHFGNRNERWLSAVADRLARYGVTPRWRSARGGEYAADEMVASAESLRADLLIIGSTHPGARSLLAPGVMNRLLQTCPCPLLVVPGRDQAKTRSASVARSNSSLTPLFRSHELAQHPD